MTRHADFVWTQEDYKLLDDLVADLSRPSNDYLCDKAVWGTLTQDDITAYLWEQGLNENPRHRRIFRRALNEALRS